MPARPRGTTATNAKSRLNSVSTALTVLEHLGAMDEAGVNEIARHLKIPPSRAYRALHTLLEHGFVAQDTTTRRYQLGLKLFELGSLVVAKNAVVHAAYPEMEKIFAETLETVNLGVLEDDEIVYLERMQNDDVLVLNLPRGRRVPAHATALGKALLTAHGADFVNDFLARLDLTRLTNKTITDPTKLRRELESARRKGYATDDQEFVEGFRCVASVIMGLRSNPLAALSISAPVRRTDNARLSELGAVVKNAAERISERLRSTPAAVDGQGDRTSAR